MSVKDHVDAVLVDETFINDSWSCRNDLSDIFTRANCRDSLIHCHYRRALIALDFFVGVHSDKDVIP